MITARTTLRAPSPPLTTAELADPNGLLKGTGVFMRRVKLFPGRGVDAKALTTMIEVAYADMTQRVRAGCL